MSSEVLNQAVNVEVVDEVKDNSPKLLQEKVMRDETEQRDES